MCISMKLVIFSPYVWSFLQIPYSEILLCSQRYSVTWMVEIENVLYPLCKHLSWPWLSRCFSKFYPNVFTLPMRTVADNCELALSNTLSPPLSLSTSQYGAWTWKYSFTSSLLCNWEWLWGPVMATDLRRMLPWALLGNHLLFWRNGLASTTLCSSSAVMAGVTEVTWHPCKERKRNPYVLTSLWPNFCYLHMIGLLTDSETLSSE